jgi:hypothetical protein
MMACSSAGKDEHVQSTGGGYGESIMIDRRYRDGWQE